MNDSGKTCVLRVKMSLLCFGLKMAKNFPKNVAASAAHAMGYKNQTPKSQISVPKKFNLDFWFGNCKKIPKMLLQLLWDVETK